MNQQIQKTIVRILVSANNEILVIKRSEDKTRPGEWEFPGGKIDFGETFEQAAVRELEEETGIKASSLEFYDTFSRVEGERHAIGVIYRVPLAVMPDISLSGEHIEHAWVSKSTWKNYDFPAAYVEFFDGYFNSSAGSSEPKAPPGELVGVEDVIIFADGGSRGNPGPSATGYAIFDVNESEIARGGQYIGITTNNQAEYLAVKQGLQRAVELGAQKIQFYLDSMLVVNQMKGVYKVRNKDLWPVHQSIKQLAEDIDVSFEHVRRENNKVADSIVNEVLDQHENTR